MSRDPIGYEGSKWNLYGYVSSIPIAATDPSGLTGPGAYPGIKPFPCPCGEPLTQVLAVGPLDARTAQRLAREAIAEAKRLAPSLPGGVGGLYNGAADAFRHCFWSCRMAQEIGEDQARKVGDIHEACLIPNPSAEEAMDQANNATGRAFGTLGADCSDKCAEAARDGMLQNSLGGDPPTGGY